MTWTWDPYQSVYTKLYEKIEHDADMELVVPAVVEKMKAQYERAGLTAFDSDAPPGLFDLQFMIFDWKAEYPEETYEGFVIAAEVRWKSLP